MLPHINTEDWNLNSSDDGILVFRRYNPETAAFIFEFDEPTPSAALNTKQSCVELLLERFQVSESLNDGCRKLGRGRWIGFCRFGRSKILPEERMVDMAAAIEFDSWLELNLCRNIVAFLSSNQCFQSVVEVSYISLEESVSILRLRLDAFT
jgi:hypothetical protein